MSSVITLSRASGPLLAGIRLRRVDETAPASCRATGEKKTPTTRAARCPRRIRLQSSNRREGLASEDEDAVHHIVDRDPVESMTTASVAGFSGATDRAESRLSRSRISCERPARLAASPFFQLVIAPAARSSALAVRNTSARRREHHRTHVPAVGHQSRRDGKRPLAPEERRPDRRMAATTEAMLPVVSAGARG